MTIRPEDALAYHSQEPAGKIAVVSTKPCRTQRDLGLAYTPGVAVPCLEIERDPALAYKYTAKGNLVAVVSNGTAVLGLGNIGALAGKPVMEGKGVLFKRFADIDVFDLELATADPKEIIRACQMLEPTFGGINLEDIKAPEPIVFAMANPDPEIGYDAALAARPDAIVATGRSDFPNQVNNVLGFPFIFRGALDVRATTINDAMKLAATRSLAALAKEDVPDSVRRAYGVEELRFGRDYIIPKPFDPRVLIWEASAVAQAAMATGVARQPVDLAEYREALERRLGRAHEFMRAVIHRARKRPLRVAFPEADQAKILRACQVLLDEKIAVPVLLGDEKEIRRHAEELRLNLEGAQIVDPAASPRRAAYAAELYALRQRKGLTRHEAEEQILNRSVFAAMMVRSGEAEAIIDGLTKHYPDAIRPALKIFGVRPGFRRVAGVYVAVTPKGHAYFLADATVNIEPDAEDLAEIAIMAAETARRFEVEPRVAMLSFSNFGGTRHPLSDKVRRATELVRKRAPNLVVDGELQADTALSPEILEQHYPFSALRGGANVLVFPNLEAGNIAYKLLAKLGGAELIGPVLVGMDKPMHVLQIGAELDDIVNMAAIAVVDAQQAMPAPAAVAVQAPAFEPAFAV